MNPSFTGTETLGDIVTRFPGASHLFKEHRIDFCCRGDRPLSNALLEQELAEKPFLDKLNQIYHQANLTVDPQTDWTKMPSSTLMDHVVDTHHAYLTRELPVISEFVL